MAASRHQLDPEAALRSVVEVPRAATIPLSQLAPEAALRHLELTIARRLDGFLHGDHLGLLPGAGSETNDAREYQPGQDDVRRMDWSVTARTATPHVRDTVADRELEIWALLDAFPKMNWGTAGVTKRDLGIAAIATIGFLGQRVGDRFGGLIVRPDGLRRLPARAGRTALYGLLRRMLTDSIAPDRAVPVTSLAEAIENLNRTEQRRGVRVIVSDFLTAGDTELDPDVPPPWERPLRAMSARQQVLAIEVVDPRELEFPNVGEVLIRDPETSFERYINTSDRAARERVNAIARSQRDRIRRSLRRAGAGHIQLRTDQDWVVDISKFVLSYRRVANMLHAPPRGVSR